MHRPCRRSGFVAGEPASGLRSISPDREEAGMVGLRDGFQAEVDRGLRILLVEDDADLRALIAEVLAERGHRVVALGDGAAAWEALQADPFPLIVLDLGLPGLDGIELCRRLRSLPDGDASVVVVLTARTTPGDLRTVLDAGADD